MYSETKFQFDLTKMRNFPLNRSLLETSYANVAKSGFHTGYKGKFYVFCRIQLKFVSEYIENVDAYMQVSVQNNKE